MPSIKLAQSIGFCTGVRRAIDIVDRILAANHKERVYSLGPVIHNREVIRRLEKKRLNIAQSLDSVEDSSIVILPSHGSPRHILALAKKKKLKLVDVTCPYVSSVQKICSKLNRQGVKVIIIGDKKHPEIKALVDLAPGACIIAKISDIPENGFSQQKIGIISQTTQARDIFFGIISKILQKNPKVKEVHVFNTICLDTSRRQEEVRQLAAGVDVLLVVGSGISANTKRLLCIGRKINKRSYLVQAKDGPLAKILKGAGSVGIISGASAPEWLVAEIVKKVKSKN